MDLRLASAFAGGAAPCQAIVLPKLTCMEVMHNVTLVGERVAQVRSSLSKQVISIDRRWSTYATTNKPKNALILTHTGEPGHDCICSK